MKKTCKPIAAGVIDIVCGSLGVLCAISLIIPIIVLEEMEVGSAEGILVAIAITCAVTGVLAIVGGAFALQRKLWGLALVGSIGALLPIPIVGIVAVILTALSRDEFK